KAEDGRRRQDPPLGAYHPTKVTYSPTIVPTPRSSKYIFSHVPGARCQELWRLLSFASQRFTVPMTRHE
ncbi:MAG: hypothetical protein ACLQVM_08935, partial [Terriglobia bacterium]